MADTIVAKNRMAAARFGAADTQRVKESPGALEPDEERLGGTLDAAILPQSVRRANHPKALRRAIKRIEMRN